MNAVTTRIAALAAALGVTAVMLAGLAVLAQHESHDPRLAAVAQRVATERAAAATVAHGRAATPACATNG